MADEDVLRVAAIMAVMSMVQQNSSDASKVGRLLGSAWSQDHRRISTGRSALMESRSRRSSWR